MRFLMKKKFAFTKCYTFRPPKGHHQARINKEAAAQQLKASDCLPCYLFASDDDPLGSKHYSYNERHLP
jgi:hypothetical protein